MSLWWRNYVAIIRSQVIGWDMTQELGEIVSGGLMTVRRWRWKNSPMPSWLELKSLSIFRYATTVNNGKMCKMCVFPTFERPPTRHFNSDPCGVKALFQEIAAPEKLNTYPVHDLRLSMSDAQSASLNPMISPVFDLEKQILRLIVPFRYLNILLTAFQWAIE